MKGDFSRIRFNPSKQYTAVLEQQGRVSLDADANEQCAIDNHLRRTETIDVVGEFGGPIGDEGFAITVDHQEILIGPGRYYVAGLMCENPASVASGNQPFLINPELTDTELLTELARYPWTSVHSGLPRGVAEAGDGARRSLSARTRTGTSRYNGESADSMARGCSAAFTVKQQDGRATFADS
jgi:Family of unknown function (DUF6519)